MILLFDIGNTNTHLGLANQRRVVRHADIPTSDWFNGRAEKRVAAFVRQAKLEGAALCSVVPRATPRVHRAVRRSWRLPCLELTPATLRGLRINYPKPDTIGRDRLANALAVRHHFGAPAIAVDFGTAVTFDVVGCTGSFVGGIIAPGLSAMTDYLHEKTAQLPRVKLRDVKHAIGQSTAEAMQIAVVHGYRGLIRGLILELKRELKVKKLPVVATGGYARLIASRLPEITAVYPNLTLEGLRLLWTIRQSA